MNHIRDEFSSHEVVLTKIRKRSNKKQFYDLVFVLLSEDT